MSSAIDSKTIKDILQLTALITISQRNGYHTLTPSLPLPSMDHQEILTEFDKELEEFKAKVSDSDGTNGDIGMELGSGNEAVTKNRDDLCQWEKARGMCVCM